MLKSTGVVRKVDELGRIVIPIELRRTLGIKEGDPLEIYIDNDRIVFKKYRPGCTRCGDVESELTGDANVQLCPPCIAYFTKAGAK